MQRCMGVNGSMCAASEFACYMYAFVSVLSMVYAFMVLLLCGGLQGFTGISVQSTTWEPGVEGYLAMG